MSILRFRQDGTFRIVQFTDIHWSDGGDQDVKTRKTMELVIAEEKPDLIIVTGDVLAGRECPDSQESFCQAVQPLEEAEIPWIVTWGNHDDEGTAIRDELHHLQRQLAHNIVPDDTYPVAPVVGTGNFDLPILPSKDKGPKANRAEALLYFLDSGSYAPKGMGTYTWIDLSQVQWFRTVAKAFAETQGSLPPGLAFFHIPLPEYNLAWESGACVGVKRESVCAPVINSGFFAALLEAGHVMGTFVGHDHLNDYIGPLHGIHLAYGRVTGYGTYPDHNLHWPRGARVIELIEGERTFRTWLRLDDGSVTGQYQASGPTDDT